jgi:hypothetical protein
MWLERHLNDSGRWRALWVDLETAREQPDPAAALSTVLETIDDALRLRHAGLGEDWLLLSRASHAGREQDS